MNDNLKKKKIARNVLVLILVSLSIEVFVFNVEY